MKGSIAASAALVASVAASAHHGHAGMHFRRQNQPTPDVCTVYTTVYVYGPESAVPSVYANSTAVASTLAYPTPVIDSTTVVVESSAESTPDTESSLIDYTTAVVESVTESTPCPESSSSVPVKEYPVESAPPAVSTSAVVYPPAAPATEVYTTIVSVGIEETPAAPTSPTQETSVAPPSYETTGTAEVEQPAAPVPSKESSVIPPSYETPTVEQPKSSAVEQPKTSTVEVEQPKTSAVEQPKTSAVEQPKTSTVEKSKTSSTPTTVPSSYDSTGRIVTKGDKWAITYTPYTDSGECRTAAQVAIDIAKISELGFTTIRTYSTDCGVFENVVPECSKYGIKVIYGVFLDAGGKGGMGPFSDYANQQVEEIISKADKDSVALIIVGNEALFNNLCTPEELASYITYVKTELTSAGFPSDIAVTTAEPVGSWESNGAALCDVIDVVAVQIHPYFTSKVDAADAGSFAKEQLALAAAVCPDAASRGKYITEIGWPKSGSNNGNAHPGVAEQKTAITNILAEVGTDSVLFSYGDDQWKEAGEYGVEQSFGCIEAIAGSE